MEMCKLPHAKRERDHVSGVNRGWLKNGNPPGDFMKAPRCGAYARTTQKSCLSPAMRNGRCRMHGGGSKGSKIQQGQRRIRQENWKYGKSSQEILECKRVTDNFLFFCKQMLRDDSFR